MTRPPRVPDWRQNLNAFIGEHRATVHSYNPDQGMCCARWIDAAKAVVTGERYPLMVKAKYKSEKGALLFITRNGCETVEQLADKTLGPRMPITLAGAGDVVLADLEKLGLSGGIPQIGLTLGICNGAVSYFVGEDGLIEIPTLTLEGCYYG